jgi:hypothetical protein
VRIEHHRGWTGARLFALVIVALAGVGLGLFGGAAKPALATGNTFTLSASAYSGGEGSGILITVNRTAGTASAIVQLQFAPTGGTPAIAGVDYTNPFTPSLPFGVNETFRTFTVSTIQNLITDGNRTFTVTVLAPTDTISPTSSAVVTITDDDGAPVFSFSQGNYPATEDAGTVLLTVNRAGGTGNPVTVQYSTSNGSAIAPGDYTATGLLTLSFLSSETTKSFSITIVNDVDLEGAETFNVTLSSPSNGGSISGSNPATVTIAASDGAGTLQWTLSSYTTSEGVGTAFFAVSRTGGSSGSISATCSTTPGSATINTEYNPIPLAGGAMVWSTGDTTDKFCQITIVDDFVLDGDKTFGLSLTSANLGAPSTATVTIQDNDGTGNLAFSSSTYAAAETSGFVTITVNRSGGSGVVGVTYTASAGTAVAGVDFTPVTSTLSWGSGDFTPKTFTVTLLDDLFADGAKTVILTLSLPSGGATLGLPSSAVLTIADNESAIPIITSLTPTAGSILGGTTVGITGSNFTTATTVTFDGIPGTGLVVNSDFSITIVTPAHIAGTVEVVVINGAGSSSTAGTANDYAYTTGPTVILLSPNTGPATGTTFVTITGTNFSTLGLIVKFGGITATANFIDAQTIIAVAPAHSAGTVDVIVTTAGGSSPNTVLDDYTYTGSTVPVVTGVSPASGPTGTAVIISGSGFTGATLVTFGGVSATFTVNSDISISATVPVAAPGGTIDVRVTTPSGQSANTSADNYNNTSGGGGLTTTYTLFFRWTLLAWSGIDNISASAAVSGLETPDNPATNNVSTTILVIWFWDGSVQRYLGNFPGSSAPGANDFTVLRRGNSYWIAVSAQVTWTVVLGQ